MADRWRNRVAALEADDHPGRLPHTAILPGIIPSELDARLNGVRIRLGESDANAPLLYGPWGLCKLIRRLRPNLVHSMELQHCGYLALKAWEAMGSDFPTWLATNWGSDIYHFSREPAHAAQIRRLLKVADFYSCECERDLGLAREMGMTARALAVMPNSGGFDLPWVRKQRSLVPPSLRRLILVKGYQHFAGRALTALAALERCGDVARDFEIGIFSASPEVVAYSERMRSTTPIRRIAVIPPRSHEDMLRLHSEARVYLGVSISDAISTSALEAMAMGAFPIQTDTSCCDEWFEHGKGGYLIPADDVDAIAERLRSALTDNSLVDQAAEINWRTVENRLDERVLRRRALALYEEVFTESRRSAGGDRADGI